MTTFKQSIAFTHQFLMVDSTTHVNGATGKNASLVVKLGKNGNPGVTATGVTAEVDAANLPGIYSIIFSPTDLNTLGSLALAATATGCDPTNETHRVDAQIFPDLAINASGQVFIASNYKQNQPALLPFTMTVGNPPVATAGLAPVGQRNFGSGFSPLAGTITDLGFGAYLASLQAADTNAPVAYYHFTSTTPNANEQDITLYFQP